MNPYLGYNSTLVIVHKKLPICFGVGVSFAISVLVGYIRRVLDFECGSLVTLKVVSLYGTFLHEEEHVIWRHSDSFSSCLRR